MIINMNLNIFFTILSSFLLSTSAQSIQLYNFTTAASGFSSTCVSVLNQNVTCDASIKWAGGHRYEDDATLSTLCTTTCSSSLTTWLRRVTGACTIRFVTSKGDSILPAFWAERVIERYNVVCLQNGGRFCNAVMRDEIGVNPVDQKQTKSAISSATCDDCFLKSLQTQLQMPLLSNPDMATTFTSLTKQCSKTSFAVTPPVSTLQYITSVTAPSTTGGTPKPTGCVGTTYTIKSGDTCQSISNAQGVSTGDLLDANRLQAFCNNFPKLGSLCIPVAAKCKTYTVKKGDTCASIGDANKLTWTQIVTWNPIVGFACQSISNLVGYIFCISNPGGDWVNPSPTSDLPTSQIPTPADTGTDASLLPTPTFGGFINGSNIWTYKYADKTRLDCHIYANGSEFGNSASCEDVAKGYGVTTKNLTDWNPSLLNKSCTLDGKLTYCVQPTRLNTTNITQYCVLTDAPNYGLSCAEFMAMWDIDYDEFSAWNPVVGSQCENWTLGREYCVMVKNFRQPGIISTCNKFAMANVTNMRLDPCGILETKYGLQHARFVAWNPSVGQNCTDMKYAYDYCVSIPNYKPTYTTKVYTFPTTPFSIPSIDLPTSELPVTSRTIPASPIVTGTSAARGGVVSDSLQSGATASSSSMMKMSSSKTRAL